MNSKIFRGWSSGDKVSTLLQLYPNCPFCPSFKRRHILGSIPRYLRVDRLIFGYGILVDSNITIVYYYSQVYLIPTNLLILLYISTIAELQEQIPGFSWLDSQFSSSISLLLTFFFLAPCWMISSKLSKT